jgi:LysM repeat protein
VIGRRVRLRWLVAASFLAPALLLTSPPASLADGQPVTTSRKPAAKPRPAKPTAAKVAATKTASTKAPASTKKSGAVAKGPAEASCTYVARRGDSVARLAARHRVSRQNLVVANGLTETATLKVGQKLTIPSCSAVAKRRPAEGPPAVQLDDGLLLARVGPYRVPTRLFVAVPEFPGQLVEFAWTVEGTIASGFGKRRTGWHAGIDIKADAGAPVLAAAGGIVTYSGWAPAYGRIIRIEHPNGFTTVYAHNNENLVAVGDEVVAGAAIATVGRTGRASGEHLHFEIRRDGMAYNPLHLLDPRDSGPILVSAPADTAEEDDDEAP